MNAFSRFIYTEKLPHKYQKWGGGISDISGGDLPQSQNGGRGIYEGSGGDFPCFQNKITSPGTTDYPDHVAAFFSMVAGGGWIDDVEERLAIQQFDGGLSRQQVEGRCQL